MKLSIPEKNITLYETGFDETDFLNRKPFADKLSTLIDKFETPFVVALDGPWGSGKSFFLKRWVGHHQKSHKDDTIVVYLDAFELDYLDEPMVALVSEISTRLEIQSSSYKKYLEQGKKFAAKLLLPAARVATAIATAGTSEVFSAAIGKGVQAAVSEIDSAATKLWEREHSRREAVTDFRKFLESLTKGVDDLPAKKIVVVIDELDRCRPDYALSMLEIIKHFFDVSDVHFILGVNLAELENMARARYGEKLDARNYIGKFIKVKVEIPEVHPDERIDFGWEIFFDKTAKRMGFDGSFKREIKVQLKMLRPGMITLRTIQRLLTAAAVVPELTAMNTDSHYRKLFCSLFLFNFLQGKKVNFNEITLSDIQDVFNFKYSKDPVNENERSMAHLYSVLAYTLNAPEFAEISEDDQRVIKNYFDSNRKPDVALLLRDYVLFATVKS